MARQYAESYPIFKKTAQHWATAFAGAKHRFADFDSALKKLREMGAEEHNARVALSSCDWEISKATEKLFC